jgi:hypothetical protein
MPMQTVYTYQFPPGTWLDVKRDPFRGSLTVRSRTRIAPSAAMEGVPVLAGRSTPKAMKAKTKPSYRERHRHNARKA